MKRLPHSSCFWGKVSRFDFLSKDAILTIEREDPSDEHKQRTMVAPGVYLSQRKKLIYFAITILTPFIFFLALELLLRLFSYGPELSLTSVERLSGKDYYVMNKDLKYRYFPPHFYPTRSPDYFTLNKVAGTYRIFCLGASTTVGYPYWYNGAFSSFLRDRLVALFPDKRFEIVNFGITATNSFTVLDMVRDLFQYQPDLLIVYDGHNEFYGGLGVASNQSLGSQRWVVELYLKLVRFRTFGLLKDLYYRLVGVVRSESSGEQAGTLMERLAKGRYVPFHSKMYRQGLEIFKTNLMEMKSLCVEHGVPLIVSSQVCNLRDQVPFISTDPSLMEPRARARFESLYAEGMALQAAGKTDSALQRFRDARSLDTLHAGLCYRIAQSLLTLGRSAAAQKEFYRARDYDQLRFRTSTEFNDAIRGIADGERVHLADMEHVFNGESRDSLVGQELMFEHVHPRARGYFLLAKEYARVMKEHHLGASSSEWSIKDTITDEQLWERRSLTEIDELIANRKTEILTSGWPFAAGVPTVKPVAPGDTLGEVVEMFTRGKWNWKMVHEAAANFYLIRKEPWRAEKEYRTIINQTPLIDVQVYLKLARLLLEQGKTKELMEVLRSSLEVEPTILACRALGDLALRAGSPRDAITYYQMMGRFPQSNREQVENGYLLAAAYAQASLFDSAAARLEEILRIQPDYRPGVELLQKIKSRK